MTIQITIIGLGQIGTSVGLGLANQKELLRRIGHDRDQNVARQAEKMDALDQVMANLPSAVRDADLVLLSLPMDQIREALSLVAPDLKEGAVVMDTCPVKEVVAAWAGELLPGTCDYIGLTPVLNPSYLHSADSGVAAAHADLFRGGLIAIAAPPRASSESIKLAADLARLLGATPLFVDPIEMDGLMAATHQLPQLLAAALLNATIDQPGWREGQKIAGRAYAEATGPIVHLSEPKTLRASVLLNHENVLRMIDCTISALQAIRNDIHEENGDALEERLVRAHNGRARWWQHRQAGEWNNGTVPVSPVYDAPSASDVFGRLLGLGRKPGSRK